MGVVVDLAEKTICLREIIIEIIVFFSVVSPLHFDYIPQRKCQNKFKFRT